MTNTTNAISRPRPASRPRRRPMIRAVTGTLAAAALALLSVGATAPTASALVCGQYQTKYDVYYGHCGTYAVKVKITYYPYYQPLPDVVCLDPGEHYIGPKAYVSRVRSDGVRC